MWTRLSVLNFILPSGAPAERQSEGDREFGRAQAACRQPQGPILLEGLGGYRGSVHVRTGQGRRGTLFYSVDVYSEFMPNGRENGIVVFDQPSKNVVATLCLSRDMRVPNRPVC